jgi:hypothetical protein
MQARHVTICTMKRNVSSAEENGKTIHIWLIFLPLCLFDFRWKLSKYFHCKNLHKDEIILKGLQKFYKTFPGVSVPSKSALRHKVGRF